MDDPIKPLNFPKPSPSITVEEFFDLVASQILFATKGKLDPGIPIALSIPGTVSRDLSCIVRSSRLGILEPFEVRRFFKSRHDLNISVVRDAPASLVGELHLHNHPSDWRSATIALMMIDEGVGAAMMDEGRLILGSGVAGEVGRLTIEPAGPYAPTFFAHGTLEGYVSRGGIVRRLMEDYRKAVRDPRSSQGEVRHPPLWDALAHITEPSELSLTLLAEAVMVEDSLAVPVFDDAARALGLGISYLITVAAPKYLVLGGTVIQMPGLYAKTLAYARRYTWGIAWNNCKIQLAVDLIQSQHIGSVIIADSGSS